MESIRVAGVADQFAAEPLDDVAKLDFAHRARP
jgi:hypothetical protein